MPGFAIYFRVLFGQPVRKLIRLAAWLCFYLFGHLKRCCFHQLIMWGFAQRHLDRKGSLPGGQVLHDQ